MSSRNDRMPWPGVSTAAAVTSILEIVEARDELSRSHKKMERARQRAEDASAAKSRILAAASHGLRQSLQTMALLESLLARIVDGDAGRLVARLNETLDTMAGLVDALLDANGTEAGTSQAAMEDLGTGDLLGREVRVRSQPSQGSMCPGVVARGPDALPPAQAVVQDGTAAGTGRRPGCVHLGKPVSAGDLLRAVHGPLPVPPAAGPRQPDAQAKAARHPGAPVVHVVDDDRNLREAIRCTLEYEGQAVEEYSSGEAFLAAYRPFPSGREECLLIDAAMPGMDGFEVLRQLEANGRRLPAIMITGRSDVSMAVRAMKAGALDFIGKPVSAAELLGGVARALDRSQDAATRFARQAAAADSVARLTPRQRDVLAMMLAGQLNKNIAADLGISQRTVETHRSTIMRRMGVRSLPALARLAMAADPGGMAINGQPPGMMGAASR